MSAGGPARLDVFAGWITAAGFASGDSVVVGTWRSSPLGRLVDVMWVSCDGQRVLLAPSAAARDYIAGLYRFDTARVVPVRGGWDGGGVTLDAGPLQLSLAAGPRDWRSWLFAARPRRLRRTPTWVELEDRVARPLVGRLIGGAPGVRAAGVAPGGQREWYSVDDYRRLSAGVLSVDGRDAGAMTGPRPDLGIGLSGFPAAPAAVHVHTLVDAYPSTRARR